MGAPSLNVNGTMPLHLIPGPSDASVSFSQQIHERMTHPQITLGNPVPFPCDLPEPNISTVPVLPPADPYNYSTPENPPQILTRIDNVQPIAEIPSTKLETDFSTPLVESVKDPIPNSFPLSGPEFISNRFSVAAPPSKCPPGIFPESNEGAVLSHSRPWLNEQAAAAPL